jgi:pimeloyl-ACP methyl ester carboxylesterase
MVADLHALLDATQVTGPYVLVGQSFGGMLSEVYAKTYSADVVGLVLVDATHEDVYLDPESWKMGDPYSGVAVKESGLQAKAALPLPDVPLIVLTHTQQTGQLTLAQEERWPAWQQELVKRTTKSKQIMAEKSGHNIQLDQPELVIAAIKEIVTAVWK